MDYYKSGGIASLAKEVRKHGRGEDSVLMHVTPGELLGLQSLAVAHGGSLTINPTTGLPEAGFLKSILPTILGAALAATGIGAPLAAGLVGVGTAAATGDIKQGLMSGLGAFGGYGLGTGLSTAGAQAAAAGSQAASAAAPAAAATTAAPAAESGLGVLGVGDSGVSSMFQPTPAGAVTNPAAQGIYPGSGTAGPLGVEPSILGEYGTVNQIPGYDVIPTEMTSVAPPPVTFENMGRGLSDLTTAEGWGRLSDAMDGPLNTALALSPFALGAISEFGGGGEEVPEFGAQYIRPYALDITNTSGQDPYAPGSTQERQQVSYGFKPLPAYKATPKEFKKRLPKGMAVGGLAALAAGGSFDDEAGEDQYARGGALPPRFLSGGGDGMSDSIKARIEGGQEARLADGEFVIPADVVSHLGNGSSKAGAKKLYSMMDKVRNARTGKKRQAPEINPKKYMPA